MAKIFISYKRNTEPYTPVATAVYEALKVEHEVFIDTIIQVGQKWAEQIQQSIKNSDYLISFLLGSSVHSEMVLAEIETAHHHGKAYGKPAILLSSILGIFGITSLIKNLVMVKLHLRYKQEGLFSTQQ